MPTPSTEKKPRKPARTTRPAPAPEVAAPREATRSILAELAAWRATHPALTRLDHDTFVARYPDAYCESLGNATRSRGTLKDALSWLRLLNQSKPKKLGDTGVSRTSHALLIEWTTQLVGAIEAHDTGAPSDAGVRLEAAREGAKVRYRQVKSRVDEALGRNDAWIASLRAHLDGERHGELDADAARLHRLADAVEAWLRGGDAIVKHALGGEGVTDATARQCREDADALESARKAAVGASDPKRDPPAVNRIEGRVLALMQSVFRAVNEARAAKKTTLVLRPGSATRRVIEPNTKRAKSDEAPTNGPAADTSAPAVGAKPAKTPRRHGR